MRSRAVGRSGCDRPEFVRGLGQCRRGEVARTVGQVLSAGQDPSAEREDHAPGRRRRHRARPERREDACAGRAISTRARSASLRPPASAAASARSAPPRSRTIPASGTSTRPRAARSASPTRGSSSCGGPTATAPASVEIRTSDGQSQKLSWAAGKSLAAWPERDAGQDGRSISDRLGRNRRQEQRRRRDRRPGARRSRRHGEGADRERLPEPARSARLRARARRTSQAGDAVGLEPRRLRQPELRGRPGSRPVCSPRRGGGRSESARSPSSRSGEPTSGHAGDRCVPSDGAVPARRPMPG